MAAIKYIKRTVALDGNSISEQLPASFFNSESTAHTFIIAAMRGGQPLMLSGAVSATFLNQNDAVVLVTGSIVDGAAVVTLSNPCYELSGRFTLTIDVAGATVYEGNSRIKRRSSGTAYDPSGEISVAALSAEIAAMRQATADANTAAAAANTARENIQGDLNAINSTLESVYTRKNLLPIVGSNNTIYGVQVTYNDGVLSAAGTGTQSGGRGVHMADFVLDAGTYTFYRSPSSLQVFVQTGSSTITIIAQLNAGTESTQFTLTNKTECFLGVNVVSGTNYNYTANIQIEKSAAFTSYSKPSEGTAIDRTARGELANNVVNIVNGVAAIDFNNTDNNKIRRFPSDSTNAPAVEGLLLNANPTTDTGFQIVVDRTGTMFYRQKWGSWGAWNEIAKRANLVFVNTSVSAIDLNTIANNTIYRVPNGSANLPTGEIQGTVITCGGTSDTSMQIFISAAGEMYYRNKWATWTAWHKAFTEGNISDTITKTNILTAFSNIYCIGDSLTWSQVYTGATTQRQAYTTYPACIEKLTGVPTTFNATPGMTTMEWWAAYNQNIIAKTNQLAIIYLGNNQGLTDTLATDAPEGVSYEQYANTNTGCYAKIIAKLKSVGAKIVLIKTYDVSETTNNVITECGSRFGCAVVENAKLPNIYRTYPDGSGVNPTHYNDFGYSQFAVNLLSAIAHLDDTMLKRILPA